MRAINLVPVEERRGARGAGGRSGGGAYVVLAVLALLVAGVTATVLTNRTVDDRKAELAAIEQEVTAQEARAAELARFTEFRALSESRISTIRSLVASRFDWGAAFNEVARVAPTRTWLTSMSATVGPGVGAQGGGQSLRAALPIPAIEITGCTTTQEGVARTLTAMRRIDGVRRVSLSSSEKTEAAGGGGSSSGDCRQGDERFPQFQMVVFFEPPTGATGPAVAATPAPTTAPTADAAGAEETEEESK